MRRCIIAAAVVLASTARTGALGTSSAAAARPQPTKALAAQKSQPEAPPPCAVGGPPPHESPARLADWTPPGALPADGPARDQVFAARQGLPLQRRALCRRRGRVRHQPLHHQGVAEYPLPPPLCLLRPPTPCQPSLSVVKKTTSIACGRPPRDTSYAFVPLNAVFATLASLFVVQRFAYKIWTGTLLTIDDWITLAALVTSLPSAVFNSHVLVPNGIGRDAWTVSFDQITTFIRFFSIMEIIYFLDMAIIKLALLFFYLRIFLSTNTRRLLIATIVFNSLLGIAFFFVAIFQCNPINYAWEKWDGEHEGQCLNINAMVKSHAIISIVLDIWMLAIPLWHLKNLNIDWKRKVGVALMFSVGTL